MDYPLYDVPWLVRDPNAYRMSAKRHQIEVRNQAVVDDYFVARANGASAREAREVVATKHGITERRFHYIFVWFYREFTISSFGFIEKRKKEENSIFVKNFSLPMEH